MDYIVNMLRQLLDKFSMNNDYGAVETINMYRGFLIDLAWDERVKPERSKLLNAEDIISVTRTRHELFISHDFKCFKCFKCTDNYQSCYTIIRANLSANEIVSIDVYDRKCGIIGGLCDTVWNLQSSAGEHRHHVDNLLEHQISQENPPHPTINLVVSMLEALINTSEFTMR